MDNDHLYNKQLQALERSVKIRPKRINGTRRSVVACIVRRPKVKHKKAPLDMFFILRASDPNGSRWSGQVGFPGGHVEDGETDTDAVCRECEEEVNFHLKKSSRFIGETRPRVVQRNVNESLVVCCHLYEMLENEIPSGQVSEVGACGWTPMTVLTDDKYAGPLNWSKFRNNTNEDNNNTSMSSMWDNFPSVQLIFQNKDDLLVVDRKHLTMEQAKERFKLWGLTLRIVNDIMLDSKLRDTPIDVHAAPSTYKENSQL